MNKRNGKMNINWIRKSSLKYTAQEIEDFDTFIILNYMVVQKIITGQNDRFNPNRCKKLVWKKPKQIVNRDINLYQ